MHMHGQGWLSNFGFPVCMAKLEVFWIAPSNWLQPLHKSG